MRHPARLGSGAAQRPRAQAVQVASMLRSWQRGVPHRAHLTLLLPASCKPRIPLTAIKSQLDLGNAGSTALGRQSAIALQGYKGLCTGSLEVNLAASKVCAPWQKASPGFLYIDAIRKLQVLAGQPAIFQDRIC